MTDEKAFVPGAGRSDAPAEGNRSPRRAAVRGSSRAAARGPASDVMATAEPAAQINESTGVVPSGHATVLLATDLSPASEPATEWALEMARRLGATLLAVSAIDPGTLRLPGGRFRARVDEVRATREREAQALVRRGWQVGVPISFLIWQGDPGEVIVEAARSEGVELIAVGSHGRRGVERALLGSVSDHVLRHAPCPVLVVGSGVEPTSASVFSDVTRPNGRGRTAGAQPTSGPSQGDGGPSRFRPRARTPEAAPGAQGGSGELVGTQRRPSAPGVAGQGGRLPAGLDRHPGSGGPGLPPHLPALLRPLRRRMIAR